ncbi:MAG: HAMP domain-containing histidine kinase [Deltaproteobacteria bacterium]|nr:HAMP domain-containing histidine kinase [Deltaproteobacteria bacterium]
MIKTARPKTVETLSAENTLLNKEVLVARRASEITASLVVDQFVKLESILAQLEEKVATEQELRLSLAEKLREAEIRERDLSKARAEAEAAREELEQANTNLRQVNHNYLEMLGFVSHELKNTLGVIFTSARTLNSGLAGPLTDNQKILVSGINRNIETAVIMTKKYLDLTRIEKGELKVQLQRLDFIADVIGPILEELRETIRQRHTELQTSYPDSLLVQGDSTLLRVVVKNLMDNALKYGRDQGLIKLEITDEDHRYRVEVFNEGQGLSPEKVKQLFGKFVRFKTGLEADRASTGLGLFITRDIVTKHGGVIKADSKEGQWMRFIITLPKEVTGVVEPR